VKLGVSTWSLLNLDVYSAVKAIGDTGVEYIELWGEVPHAHPGWVDRVRLKDVLSTYDMIVTAHAPFTDLNIGSTFQPVKGAIEETLEGFVEFCVDLGVSKVTFHPGSSHNEQLVAEARASSVATLRRMIRAASRRLSINVENMTKSASRYYYPFTSTPESLLSLLTELPESGCTFDTGHAHASGVDLSKMRRSLDGRMTEVHLSDNMGSSDDHLVPGKGNAPLKEFMEDTNGSQVLVCLELNPHRYTAEEVLGAVSTMVRSTR